MWGAGQERGEGTRDAGQPSSPKASTSQAGRGTGEGRGEEGRGGSGSVGLRSGNCLQEAPGAPALNAIPDATWGLHLVDANIGLGNLAKLVREKARRYLSARR